MAATEREQLEAAVEKTREPYIRYVTGDKDTTAGIFLLHTAKDIMEDFAWHARTLRRTTASEDIPGELARVWDYFVCGAQELFALGQTAGACKTRQELWISYYALRFQLDGESATPLTVFEQTQEAMQELLSSNDDGRAAQRRALQIILEKGIPETREEREALILAEIERTAGKPVIKARRFSAYLLLAEISCEYDRQKGERPQSVLRFYDEMGGLDHLSVSFAHHLVERIVGRHNVSLTDWIEAVRRPW